MVKKERKLRKEELESFTLASAFEMIYEKSCDSKLSPEFYDTCNDAINFVSKELNVTHFQSIILAILANSDDSISLNQMSSYTKCSPIRFRIHKEELDDLHYRHFVQWVMARYSLEYRIRDEFMEAIIDNVPYTPKKYEDYTTYDVYTKIAKWIEMLKRDEGLYEDIVKNVRRLLESTRHLFVYFIFDGSFICRFLYIFRPSSVPRHSICPLQLEAHTLIINDLYLQILHSASESRFCVGK
jgi:hypothetical protein